MKHLTTLKRRVKLLLAFSCLVPTVTFSQVVGGRDNSEMTPKVAEATKLTGGTFTGDVNNMTGEFSASIPLGSVSTPAGLGFTLILNNSSSFAFSQTQPMTAGIPYGEGWSPNIPTISVQTDVLHKFSCEDIRTDGMFGDPLNFNDGGSIGARDEGDLYWFAPTISIPGVASGRAVFKYIDQTDDNALVFVLNTFESPVEIRFYGNNWTVKLADGTRYEFRTHLANYRSPSNQRALHYDQGNLLNSNANSVVETGGYSSHTASVQNAIEPKQSYSVWHCDLISNQNTPLQGIRFKYEKFGEFNYFQEFTQSRYVGVRDNVLNASTNTDFSAYTDIFLKEVHSYVMETPLDIVELDYRTQTDLLDNNTMLDYRTSLVERKDSLYSYATVESWDGSSNNNAFDDWKRYKHIADVDITSAGNPTNPYLNSNGAYYFRDLPDATSGNGAKPFDHGFLESDRILTGGSNLYPGDIYEIKTTITRDDATALDMGNGTVDIALFSGTLDNGPTDESNTYIDNNQQIQDKQTYKNLKGIEVFSTFNSALKWQMGYGQAVLSTSNFFTMPNLPSTFDGMNIQIGPGNSDIDFGASDQSIYYSGSNGNEFFNIDPSGGVINALEAYPFASNQRSITSTGTIPHNFGTGHPWGMMIPVYNYMALNQNLQTGSSAQPSELYDTWWSNYTDPTYAQYHPNTPTKFDETVKLEKVELIRYSKNPWMLSGVRSYKINGDYAQTADSTVGRILITQKELEYASKDDVMVRNYNYGQGAPIHTDYQRRIILLSRIREIPVDSTTKLYEDNYGLATASDTSKVLTTYLSYSKILDNDGSTNFVPMSDSSTPYQGLNQWLLSGYTDHLGGITKVQYYPIAPLGSGASPTRIQSNYNYNFCTAIQPVQEMGDNIQYTAHVAVKYLAKNDEGDGILDNNNLNFPSNKVWYYDYDLSSVITKQKRPFLPKPLFRSQFFTARESAFGKVRVYSPKLADGSQTMVEYNYHGNGMSGEENHVLYGKLKSQISYEIPVGGGTPIKHDEKLFEYGYTLAFKNAYVRPNPVRKQLGYESLFYNSHEYEDIYKDEVLSMDITSGGTTITYTGEAAYPFIDAPALHGLASDRELPKFLEFKFYNELRANDLNPAYFFDSYFVKKTSEISRVYEEMLAKSGTSQNITTPVYDDKSPNPFGVGVSNSGPYNEKVGDQQIQLIDVQASDATGALISASPLSDRVLGHMITSSMKANDIANVLAIQGGLSNEVLEKVIDKKSIFSRTDIDNILGTQAYLADEVLLYFITNLGSRDDYEVARKVLLKNSYLSNQVVLAMTQKEGFPAEVFADVISEQSPLSESVLIDVISAYHFKDVNLVRMLKNQGLTDVTYSHLLNKTELSTDNLTTLIEESMTYPSDNILIQLLNRSTKFDEKQVLRIFAVSNRTMATTVQDALLTNYSADLADQLIGTPYTGNPLDQYCDNLVETGRTYLETRTDFEYYEANYKGEANNDAHLMLLGLKSTVEDASPYPYTVTDQINGKTVIQPVNTLRLKHEPSWQLFSKKTYSDHLPGAYNSEEYYYLYDLQNRYDRYWYNYDFTTGDFDADRYDFTPSTFSADTVAFYAHWDPYYANVTEPRIPQFDGMERSRTYGNRVLAFQKTLVSKNTRDEKPLIRSEYFDYDRRWQFNDLPGDITVEHYDGDTCDVVVDTGCDDLFDCTECYWFKYTTYEAMQAVVPYGYCAYQDPLPGGNGYGTFICPQGVDHSQYAPNAVLLYCNGGTISGGGGGVGGGNMLAAGPKALPLANYFSKTLLMRSVTVQVDTLDHSTEKKFSIQKMDSKNKYIAEFTLGSPNDVDANNFESPYEMIYPFDHLTVRTILERNRYLQPQLEENQIGLQTKYYYDKSKTVWNVNNNNNTGCPGLGNYLSRVNSNVGLPARITVGYNRLDSLGTSYAYNNAGVIEKVTEPSGKFMEYTFDKYYRLTSTKENNTRHLSDIEYFNWGQNIADTFELRTTQNYVQTNLYNSDPTIGINALDNERRKAFIDPLGRNHSIITAYSTALGSHREIHSGTVEYDNWGRVTKAYKNYTWSSANSNIGLMNVSAANLINHPFAETQFENTPKGRALRTSNYDVDVNSNHVVKTTYALTNNVYASCELDLSSSELELIMGEGLTNNYRLVRTSIKDQDDKQSVEYSNAFGQKVATLKYNDNNQKVVTLFVYDSYGNLNKVINPEKQENTFEYNILGQLVKETSVDAGTKRYMYNKQGLVSVTLDELGQFFDPNGDGSPTTSNSGNVDPFYRVFKYDDYGRQISVARHDGPNHFSSELYGPLFYTSVSVGTPQTIGSGLSNTPSGDYFQYTYTNASSQDWLASYEALVFDASIPPMGGYVVTEIKGFDLPYSHFGGGIKEKAYSYGFDPNLVSIGKVIQSVSYNNDGVAVQKVQYEYDQFDNISREVIEFNADQDVFNNQGNLTSIIDYAAYNYRNTLLEQKIDVNGDNTVDYHCFMEYDPLNRLVAIYGAAGQVNNKSEATLLTTYEHDDANGLIEKKTHFVDNNQLSVLVSEIEYSYDTRDRLTRINAGAVGQTPMMDYRLFYDDNTPIYQNGSTVTISSVAHNWNGNINGSLMKYDFSGANIHPSTNVINFMEPTLYGFSYDKINRLTDADGWVGDFVTEGGATASQIGDVAIGYDRIGNIQTLHRTRRNEDPAANAPYMAMQDFTYKYQVGKNRLLQVATPIGTDNRLYTYDANGNLLTDNQRGIDKTTYGRASYAFTLEKGDETIDYLYSGNDLRIYKKVFDAATQTSSENYYLVDAMGKTVAIQTKTTNNPIGTWEYFASGSERECKLTPQPGQMPGSNASNSSFTFEKDQVNFYLYDHLGNTRVTYMPSGFTTPSGTLVSHDEFSGTTDNWMPASTVSVASVAGELEVQTTATSGSISKFLPINSGTLYEVSFDVDLGTAPELLLTIISNGMPVQTVSLDTTGVYSTTFTAQNPPSIAQISVVGTQGVYRYTIDNFKVNDLTGATTTAVNKINYVGDFFPYGKTLREFVNGDKERYLTTQHERDDETGLDYRGARYYDSDVARFLSLDPLAKNLPSRSPYDYVLSNPISFIDPDGKFPWPIYVRSFISAPYVAGSTFIGDGRHVSTSKTVTSRVRTSFVVDPAEGTLSNAKTVSDETIIAPLLFGGIGKTGSPNNEIVNINDGIDGKSTIRFNHSGKDPITPKEVTPSLDVKGLMTIAEDLENGTLTIKGVFVGDVFPSTEAFIEDQGGQRLLLGGNMEEGGIMDLFGDNRNPLFEVDVTVQFDKEGNFTGVLVGGETYDIETWNDAVFHQIYKQD